jgi:hypothetical protein
LDLEFRVILDYLVDLAALGNLAVLDYLVLPEVLQHLDFLACLDYQQGLVCPMDLVLQ